MSEQEKREQYLRANGWKRSEVRSTEHFGSWDHLQYGDGLTERDALKQQLYNDADAAIDAMLRLPALEAKLARASNLVDEMANNALEGDREGWWFRIRHDDLNALSMELSGNEAEFITREAVKHG